MKRDMDLIRELLLKIENGQTSFILTSDTAAALSLSPAEGGMTAEAAAKLEEHLILLEQAGFIEIMSRSLPATMRSRDSLGKSTIFSTPSAIQKFGRRRKRASKAREDSP